MAWHPASSSNGVKERTVLAMTVYEALKGRIMDQVVTPGERLNIDGLAVDLEVSQTPIREALVRLTSERLVTFEPYRGYAVNPLPSNRDLSELIHVRKLLEGDAVRLAASRISPIGLDAIDRVVEEMSDLNPRPIFKEYRAFSELDQQFHELIIGAADNAILLDLYRSLHVHVQNARFYRENGNLAVPDTVNEHRAIFRAIVARDADAAVQAMLLHIDKAYVRAVSPQRVMTKAGVRASRSRNRKSVNS